MIRQISSALTVLAAIAVAIYGLMSPAANTERTGLLSDYLKGPMAGLTVVEEPDQLTKHIITKSDGTPIALRDMAGKAMLVNIWASYCLPCRAEMPELAGLQKELGDDTFEVVAINVDRGGHKMAAEILEEWGVSGLNIYADPTAKIAFDLAQGAMPMSLIVDRKGLVRAYYLGALKWDGPEALAFFSALKSGEI